MANIRGTNNADNLIGTQENDTVWGLEGADTFRWTNGVGNDTFHGGTGGENFDQNPYSPGNPGGDLLFLEGDGARIVFSDWNDGAVQIGKNKLVFTDIERVYGTEGNDIVNAGKAAPLDGWHGISIFTGDGDDSIVGSAFDDIINGGAGNDTIKGGAGHDFIDSSTGNDLIYGGAGGENIRWGIGDAHWHNPGNDTIYGGDGHDLINVWVWDGGDTGGVGTPGANVSVRTVRADGGFAGTATVGTGDGNAMLRFQGFELGWTHMGNDSIDASRAKVMGDIGINWNARWGDDRIIGSSGADTLVGDEGRDTISGGKGNDQIWIGRERAGDGDVDTIILRAGDGQDTIYGFGAEDVLDLAGRAFDVQHTSSGSLLSFGGGDSILLSGVFDF